MKRNILLYAIISLLLCAILFLFSSCEATKKTATEIRNEIPTEYRTITIGEEDLIFDIDEFTVELRREIENEQSEIIFCTATLTDSYNEWKITLNYRLTYLFYEKGGWVLDKVEVLNDDEAHLELLENQFPHELTESYLMRFSSYQLTDTEINSRFDDYRHNTIYSLYGTYQVEGWTVCDELYKTYHKEIGSDFTGNVTFRGDLRRMSWNQYSWDDNYTNYFGTRIFQIYHQDLNLKCGFSEEELTQAISIEYPGAIHESQKFYSGYNIDTHIYSIKNSDSDKNSYIKVRLIFVDVDPDYSSALDDPSYTYPEIKYDILEYEE